ncbi:acetate/propionate family kinase [Candidatus Woesearchaeota archaeon]|jgi:acetate kinase|nr:acetate/propionate family kinase [Candidatus Woesearchaeota archaeon]
MNKTKIKNILILNLGSSSIKYALFIEGKQVNKGLIERVINFKKELLNLIKIINKDFNCKIHAIGHRVVHGGDIKESKKITAAVVKKLEKISVLAPLHDIPEIEGIKTCLELFKIPQVAIFDTAFHASIPPKAFTYALPKLLCKQNKIRRYGFHGESHNYVSGVAAKLLKKPISRLKIISCHLGNGSSVCAIKNGKSVDTSMGFTPLEGLVMGTRSGDLDPAIILFLQDQKNMSSKQINQLLNCQSGLKGICGSSDMRDIHTQIKKDSSKSKKSEISDAKLAEEVFCYRVAKYIGSYVATLNGVDAILFTAGIGEHAWWIRKNILSYFKYLGVDIDINLNKKNNIKISSKKSKVSVFVIPTNEEKMMYLEVINVLK